MSKRLSEQTVNEDAEDAKKAKVDPEPEPEFKMTIDELRQAFLDYDRISKSMDYSATQNCRAIRDKLHLIKLYRVRIVNFEESSISAGYYLDKAKAEAMVQKINGIEQFAGLLTVITADSATFDAKRTAELLDYNGPLIVPAYFFLSVFIQHETDYEQFYVSVHGVKEDIAPIIADIVENNPGIRVLVRNNVDKDICYCALYKDISELKEAVVGEIARRIEEHKKK
jgi:hypothetical protein